MADTWTSEAPVASQRLDAWGWIRCVRRGLPAVIVTFGCLGILLLVRLIERPFFEPARPITPGITRFVCHTVLWLLGIRHEVLGQPMRHIPGAMIANHASWLDIFALNASARVYFVAKLEVSGWFGIGWLARATGTLFIRRARQDAREHHDVVRERLLAGHLLLFFPEGTSTDGRRVLKFKSTLFSGFFAKELRTECWIQPITIAYTAPLGADPRFYSWYGNSRFGPHLIQVLASRRQGRIRVTYHDPLRVADFADRKHLAGAAENIVRLCHRAALD